MNDSQEKLGQAIDMVDNLAHALKMPIPNDMHVDCLRSSLPDVVGVLKRAFIELTGENPWE